MVGLARREGMHVVQRGVLNVAGMAVSKAQMAGCRDQGVQQGCLNDARNHLALLCRDMVGLKINAHWILVFI